MQSYDINAVFKHWKNNPWGLLLDVYKESSLDTNVYTVI